LAKCPIRPLHNSSIYTWVANQVWGQDGWILALACSFLVSLWTETESSSINLQEKNEGNINLECACWQANTSMPLRHVSVEASGKLLCCSGSFDLDYELEISITWGCSLSQLSHIKIRSKYCNYFSVNLIVIQNFFSILILTSDTLS